VTGELSPQEIVERILEHSRADGTVVLVDEHISTNVRFAYNTLTTNGLMRSRSITVVATIGTGTGTAAGVLARSAVSAETLEPLVRAAEAAAVANGDADDAAPLVAGDAAADWAEPPGETSEQAFNTIAPDLGQAFSRATAEERMLYGYVEHAVTTTYVGSSTGLRLRHELPTGHIGITGKSADLARSAWVGQSASDLSQVDIATLDAELERRLGWARRSVDLDAGTYDLVLPPTAVADLLIYAYWSMAARDAHEGRSVYGRPGEGALIGEQLIDRSQLAPTLWSDPAAPALSVAPHHFARSSHTAQSVFDTGMPLNRTEWIRQGQLTALLQTRETADLTNQPVTPPIDNLVLDVHGGHGTTDDLVSNVNDGLLLTCLWYIRAVDPQTLLLTGLTRDGVYVVRDGEIVGAANNFRFNESPISLLNRFSAAGSTVPCFSREWGDYFPRTAMPPLRVPDFRMSSVSAAT